MKLPGRAAPADRRAKRRQERQPRGVDQQGTDASTAAGGRGAGLRNRDAVNEARTGRRAGPPSRRQRDGGRPPASGYPAARGNCTRGADKGRGTMQARIRQRAAAGAITIAAMAGGPACIAGVLLRRPSAGPPRQTACSRRPTSTTGASLDVIATDDWILWGRGIGGHPPTGAPANRPPVCPSSTLRVSLLDMLEVALGCATRRRTGEQQPKRICRSACTGRRAAWYACM